MTDTARRRWRTAALLAAGAGLLFWLYTFYGIAQVPQGDGSGFQWVAVMPLGVIFFGFTLPALILNNRAPRIALALGLTALVLFALLWRELLSEFYHTG